MGKPLRWLQEINRFIPVRPHFVPWGNVHDSYPFFADPDQPPVTLLFAAGVRDHPVAPSATVTVEIDAGGALRLTVA